MKKNSQFFTNISYMFAGGAIVVAFHAIFGMAYAQQPAQTFGEVYVSLALSIISLANTVYAQYLAQKARATGQAPNETDLKIQQQLASAQEKLQHVAGAVANLTDFIGNTVAPDQYAKIQEGSLPYIKAKEVTKKVGEIEEDVKHGADLLGEIEGKVS